MTRKPNKTPSRPRIHTLTFLPHEFARFKRYPVNPKPGSKIGGEQRMVNYIFDGTDRATLICLFDTVMWERMQSYIKKYGPGGPQKILRDSCIPALRREGIELSW